MAETRINELDPWRMITVDENWITETRPDGDGSLIRLDREHTRRAVAAALLEGLEPGEVGCNEHEPVQHRDGKPPWCNACGLTEGYWVPLASFASKKGFKPQVKSEPAPKRPVTVDEIRSALTRAQTGKEDDGVVRIHKERAVELLADLVGAADPATEKAVQVAASALDGIREGAQHIDDYRKIVQALKDAGLLVGEAGA